MHISIYIYHLYFILVLECYYVFKYIDDVQVVLLESNSSLSEFNEINCDANEQSLWEHNKPMLNPNSYAIITGKNQWGIQTDRDLQGTLT